MCTYFRRQTDESILQYESKITVPKSKAIPSANRRILYNITHEATFPDDLSSTTPLDQFTFFDKYMVINGERPGIDWPRQAPLYPDLAHLEPAYGDFPSIASLIVTQPRATTWVDDMDVPLAAHAWARNAFRSLPRRSPHDRLLVLSQLFRGVDAYLHALRRDLGSTQSIVCVVLRGTADGAPFQVPSLNVYGVDVASEADAEALRAAWVEMADVYVGVQGEACGLSDHLETPALCLVPDPEMYQPSVDVVPEAMRSEGTTSSSLATGVLVRASYRLFTRYRVDVTFASYLDATMGYGSSAEEMLLALIDEADLRVQFHVLEKPDPDDTLPDLPRTRARRAYSDPRVFDLIQTRHPADIYLGYYIPTEDAFWPLPRPARKAKVLFLYTTFETTRAPLGWTPILHVYDHLLVSCEAMVHAFRRAGLRTVPVSIVPLGVKLKKWPMVRRAVPADGGVRFLLFADGTLDHHRKHYASAVLAFLDAFGLHHPTHTLVIKTTRAPDTDLLRLLRRFLRPASGRRTSVVWLTGRQTQQELVQLLATCHCFVFPSHGEGFGLPPREAMATGLPVVLAGFAGLAPIAAPQFAYPVPFGLVNATGYGFWERFNEGHGDFGQWADVSVSDLRDAMREVVSDVALALEKGRRARTFIEQHETYRHTALKLKHLMQPNLFLRCSSDRHGNQTCHL